MNALIIAAPFIALALLLTAIMLACIVIPITRSLGDGCRNLYKYEWVIIAFGVILSGVCTAAWSIAVFKVLGYEWCV